MMSDAEKMQERLIGNESSEILQVLKINLIWEYSSEYFIILSMIQLV